MARPESIRNVIGCSTSFRASRGREKRARRARWLCSGAAPSRLVACDSAALRHRPRLRRRASDAWRSGARSDASSARRFRKRGPALRDGRSRARCETTRVDRLCATEDTIVRTNRIESNRIESNRIERSIDSATIDTQTLVPRARPSPSLTPPAPASPFRPPARSSRPCPPAPARRRSTRSRRPPACPRRARRRRRARARRAC